MDRRLTVFCFTFFIALGGCRSSDSDGPSALEAAAAKRIAYGKGSQPVLETAASCQALEQELKALAAAEIETFFEWSGSPQPGFADPPNAAPPAEADDSAGQDGEFTNNQVAGVDEADFIKTDGKRLYVLENSRLYRFDIPAPGQVQPAGSLALEGTPTAMLLNDNRVLVVSNLWKGGPVDMPVADMPFLLDERTKITLIEWPDGTPGTVVQERYFDGRYLTARESDAIARIILHGRLPNPLRDSLWQYAEAHEDVDAAKAAALADLEALSLDALLPRSYLPAGGALRPQPYTADDCAAFEIPADSNGSGVTSIVSLDMHRPEGITARHIVSNYPTVHVSNTHLFLAESAQDWWWYSWHQAGGERLNLHAFAIEGSDIVYAGSARVEGAPINQFAMDGQDGVLRIATWTGGARWWWTDAPVESRLYTLSIDARGLKPLGELAGIAPGEQLFAARFVGDMAYLVTFEQIDPLFAIDLSDPANPAIRSELEVPGFSTYLHPLEGGRLLAVGVGGDETGLNWNTVVSLFDVNDPAAPALLARHDLARDNSGWNWSEALYEHKAFQFHAERGLLAVPLGAHRSNNGILEWSSTLELVKVENSGLSSSGSIDHSAYFGSIDQAPYYSPDIRRSFFIGDFIYAISARAITVHPADNPAIIHADALIPGESP